MKPRRIEFGGEVFDGAGFDAMRARRECLSDAQVVEVELVSVGYWRCHQDCGPILTPIARQARVYRERGIAKSRDHPALHCSAVGYGTGSGSV